MTLKPRRLARITRVGTLAAALSLPAALAPLAGARQQAAAPLPAVAPTASLDPARGVNTDDPALAARLASLVEKLDAKRVEQHIPGLTFAIVKDGKVVLARGLGVSDLATGTPVDDTTVFAIGSQTKSFTTMLISMLADEGKIKWEDHPRTYVPEFKLFDPEADKNVTLLDACSHRVGLPRTELLWVSGKASKEQMLEAFAKAEPTAKFREKWQYSNIMFMTAGMAAANAAGTTWHRLVADRIFTPLGMNDSSTDAAVMQRHPDHSKPYAWEADAKSHKLLPMRTVTCDGCGAINSTAQDMAKWLTFLLDRGEFNGKRLVSKAMIDLMWTKQMDMGSGAGYGLGWMLSEWNGKSQVDHGGNVDGFFTACAMLPDERLGFVLMGNLTYAALQGEALSMVWETFFPPAPSTGGEMTEAQLQAFVGKYRFDQMKIDCTVNIKDGKLHVEVPGQTNYELKSPDADGKWAFALTDTIKVAFNKTDAGNVESMTMFQAGMEFLMPLLGPDGKPVAAANEQPAPFTAAQLREFTGTYHFPPANVDWKVIIKDGKVAVDVPQQMAYELKWPDDKGHWAVALAPKTMSCAFNRNAEGKIESMSWFQGGQEIKLPRTADGETSDLPTLDQITALLAKSVDPAKLRALGDIEMTGTLRAVNQGVSGSVRATVNPDGRLSQNIDMGVFGFIRAAYDGTRAWTESVGEPFTELTGERLAETKRTVAQLTSADLRTMYDSVEVVDRSKIDGKEVWVVKGTTKVPDTTDTLYLNPENGLTVKSETSMLAPGLGRLPMTVRYENYQPVGGVMLPMKVIVDTDVQGRVEMIFDKITPNAKIAPDAYVLKPAASAD